MVNGHVIAAASPRVLFAAGQTAGHVYPALAIASRLRHLYPTPACFFAATADGFERDLITRAGYQPEIVRAAPLRGGSIFRWARGLAVLPAALADAAALARRIAPDVAIGTGGYLSGPILLAAARHGVATMIVELNVRPGLTNRWLAPFVDAAAVAWPETAASFGAKALITGAPVRPELFNVTPCRFEAALNVLVLGGSQGARTLNRVVVDALPALERERGRVTLTHQTGLHDDGVRAAYAHLKLESRVCAFFDNMAAEYSRADLVIAAAGGTTCAEIAAVGRPSVLVPLAAAGHHQRRNARAMACAGAAAVIDEGALTPAALVDRILGLLDDSERRRTMAAAARALARPSAADAVANLVHRLVERRVAEPSGR